MNAEDWNIKLQQEYDIITCRLPLPFALKWVNCFLIRGMEGYTLLDTGLHYNEEIETWQQFLQQHNIQLQEIRKIVLTHYHPDHYGMAGWFQQNTGATVHISETDYRAARLFWDRDTDQGHVLADLYRSHGLPEQLAKDIPSHIQSFVPWVEPHPDVNFIEDGDKIEIGDRMMQAIHTPGHSDGHMAFYDADRKILFAGDHLLPRITPNISLWPKSHHNPLQLYLQALDRIAQYDVQIVIPSHGSVFTHFHERIVELQEHHKLRLDQIVSHLEQSKRGLTAYEVCSKLFGDIQSIHNIRFAMAEILAHLVYLKANKTIQEDEQPKIHRFSL